MPPGTATSNRPSEQLVDEVVAELAVGIEARPERAEVVEPRVERAHECGLVGEELRPVRARRPRAKRGLNDLDRRDRSRLALPREVERDRVTLEERAQPVSVRSDGADLADVERRCDPRADR